MAEDCELGRCSDVIGEYVDCCSVVLDTND